MLLAADVIVFRKFTVQQVRARDGPRMKFAATIDNMHNQGSTTRPI
jgi:hypothetical protein